MSVLSSFDALSGLNVERKSMPIDVQRNTYVHTYRKNLKCKFPGLAENVAVAGSGLKMTELCSIAPGGDQSNKLSFPYGKTWRWKKLDRKRPRSVPRVAIYEVLGARSTYKVLPSGRLQATVLGTFTSIR